MLGLEVLFLIMSAYDDLESVDHLSDLDLARPDFLATFVDRTVVPLFATHSPEYPCPILRPMSVVAVTHHRKRKGVAICDTDAYLSGESTK